MDVPAHPYPGQQGKKEGCAGDRLLRGPPSVPSLAAPDWPQVGQEGNPETRALPKGSPETAAPPKGSPAQGQVRMHTGLLSVPHTSDDGLFISLGVTE